MPIGRWKQPRVVWIRVALGTEVVHEEAMEGLYHVSVIVVCGLLAIVHQLDEVVVYAEPVSLDGARLDENSLCANTPTV